MFNVFDGPVGRLQTLINRHLPIGEKLLRIPIRESARARLAALKPGRDANPTLHARSAHLALPHSIASVEDATGPVSIGVLKLNDARIGTTLEWAGDTELHTSAVLAPHSRGVARRSPEPRLLRRDRRCSAR